MWDRCEIPILSTAHTLTIELLHSRRPSIASEGNHSNSECCDKQTHKECPWSLFFFFFLMYIFLPCCKLSGSSAGGLENFLVLVQKKYILKKCLEFCENRYICLLYFPSGFTWGFFPLVTSFLPTFNSLLSFLPTSIPFHFWLYTMLFPKQFPRTVSLQIQSYAEAWMVAVFLATSVPWQ